MAKETELNKASADPQGAGDPAAQGQALGPSPRQNERDPSEPWAVLTGPQLMADSIAAGMAVIHGYGNKKGLPPFPVHPLGKSKQIVIGQVSVRNNRDRGVEFAILGGTAPVLNLTPLLFALLVESANDSVRPDILLQAHSESDVYRGSYGRGQILARLLIPYSCIVVARGAVGRVIRGESDIVRVDRYYIPRETIQVFYVLGRHLALNGGAFDEMFARFPGWVEWTIPETPCGNN